MGLLMKNQTLWVTCAVSRVSELIFFMKHFKYVGISLDKTHPWLGSNLHNVHPEIHIYPRSWLSTWNTERR